MLSSSRSKANGFSLRCCGSDLCRKRLPGAAPASRSEKAGRNIESLSSAGVSSGIACFPSACGTGVQGCQEEVEGALHSALLSSAACLWWEGAAEPPGLTMEPDLMKDISCKDRHRVSSGWGWLFVRATAVSNLQSPGEPDRPFTGSAEREKSPKQSGSLN